MHALSERERVVRVSASCLAARLCFQQRPHLRVCKTRIVTVGLARLWATCRPLFGNLTFLKQFAANTTYYS